MKKLTLILVTIIISISLFSQSPQAFKYQAVVRDNVGNIIANQEVSFRISIHDETTSGTVVYQETHSVTTNDFGLAILEVGNGGPPIIGNISDIDWGTNPKFLEVELDPANGSSYVSMGTTQLLAVPYALYSESSGNVGAIDDLTDGRTIGTSVFLGSGAGANDDGTNNRNVAVGIEALATNTYGSWNTATGFEALYLNISGGYNTANGVRALYLNTSGICNTANGVQALYANSTGKFNTANGDNALSYNWTGSNNTASGYYSNYYNEEGSNNTIIGYEAGRGTSAPQ